MVNHPKVVTVEFWELRATHLKQMSTSLKNESRCDGSHACLTEQVKHVWDLPREINGFTCVTDIESITIPSESMTVRYERWRLFASARHSGKDLVGDEWLTEEGIAISHVVTDEEQFQSIYKKAPTK